MNINTNRVWDTTNKQNELYVWWKYIEIDMKQPYNDTTLGDGLVSYNSELLIQCQHYLMAFLLSLKLPNTAGSQNGGGDSFHCIV